MAKFHIAAGAVLAAGYGTSSRRAAAVVHLFRTHLQQTAPYGRSCLALVVAASSWGCGSVLALQYDC